VHPAGLEWLPAEGVGEVQTPLHGPGAARLRVGDRVWFRHAKAGELCEHVDLLHALTGDEPAGELPTYRGEGMAFG
jgi:D-serine deaminase-like pyridoxal phosphate-dependent protein